jgi:excisionase family DNA binding protein
MEAMGTPYLSVPSTASHRAESIVGRSVSLAQAATLLGVSRRTVYNRIRTGHLQTIRTIGGSQRVLLESLHRHKARLDEAGDASR